ncbi:ADP-ribosylglycohydrolase family protein [Pelagicoccus mobilis]|uniref:ADP-ribosylglycohydrolase family protein n=1 Tax=Pelagicoccus mobilis TaxID=415221 RepID=A0A934S701_9BACT|nr:ADP-ribosylglycohydrolase family protein [Pelagicoccus mobilis]MBK1880524.1 ADP-ribosylglycohydrolase family protein [Pelagicoccus mobilis]
MPTHSISKEVAPSDDVAFANDVIRAAFAADTFSLGAHWIYDLEEIGKLYPEGLSDLDAPRSKYHPGKSAGDFTHHGDQSLALLESLAKRGEWSVDFWAEDFAAYWASDPQSYLDGAARDTLENLKQGKREPSGSEDLAGVSRIAPLFALIARSPLEEQVSAARSIVGVTHGDTAVADAAEFFVRAIAALRRGAGYEEAFEAAIEEGTYSVDLSEYVSAARSAIGGELNAVATSLGQSCSTSKGFPLTVWLALSYGDDPVRLLEQNALAGGDNSARGMILGMLLAARGEFSKLPVAWTNQQTAKVRIDSALSRLA